MGNRLATIDMGRKVGFAAAVPPFLVEDGRKLEAEATERHKH